MNGSIAGHALLAGLLAIGAASVTAETQQAGKVYRIGYQPAAIIAPACG
jgi:hypothetical protein